MGITVYHKENTVIQKVDLPFTLDQIMIKVNNHYSQSDIWDGIIVHITDANTNTHVIIGNIYKPPRNNNTSMERSTNELGPVLELLEQRICDLCLAGELNINIFKMAERLQLSDFYDKMLNHSLYPKIIFPAGFSSHNFKLIYCKLSNNTLKFRSLSDIL